MHEQLAQDQLYMTADILILALRSGQLDLLLSCRTALPYQRYRALSGWFIAPDESAETSAKRLLAEMLTEQAGSLEQLYIFSDANRDPLDRVISAACLLGVPWLEIETRGIENQIPLRSFENRNAFTLSELQTVFEAVLEERIDSSNFR